MQARLVEAAFYGRLAEVRALLKRANKAQFVDAEVVRAAYPVLPASHRNALQCLQTVWCSRRGATGTDGNARMPCVACRVLGKPT